MVDFASAIGFASFSLAIAVSPGPSWLYVISSTTRRGRTAGLAAVAGNATGIMCHVIAAALGLSAILHYSATAYTIVKWAGALYLMFLAVRIVLDRSSTIAPNPIGRARCLRSVYRDGVFVNALNPKVSLLMLAILPQFIDVAAGQVAIQLLCLGSIHAVIASIVLTLIVMVATRTAGVLRSRPAVETAARWLAGTLLFGLGVRMASSS
ncbi:MAG: LysE family translocator [Planctomycetaceae bacterium]|nr:LysE family translocator [Planctomycetales bacterium]MCB9874547.1 LysE family translocator [Planctomycetaceae bacterium]MCB9941581.1 LysE family translocator [Planctomycetaceae bacterium]HRX78124.1 LysE family translocator [Pirellulaceae bacterium]